MDMMRFRNFFFLAGGVVSVIGLSKLPAQAEAVHFATAPSIAADTNLQSTPAEATQPPLPSASATVGIMLGIGYNF